MDTAAVISDLKAQSFYSGQICHIESLPPRAARYGRLAKPLHPVLQACLERHHLGRFYTHQAEAVNHILEGEHVMVATSSASGKSLCYNTAVMQAILTEPGATALYLFPTKALAQDQLGKLRALFEPDILTCDQYATYDGDTPSRERALIRRKAKVVLSNPDMLHVSLMPNHATWGRFFRHLRYVVVDEAHIYRGVFGTHVSFVLRRLRRLCAAYGSHPQFILASATLDNPAEHAERLTGLPFAVVADDGSPKGGKDFVFWNPPVTDPARGSRRSANIEAANITSELVSVDIRTLCFTRTRRLAELVANYVRDRLRQVSRPRAEKVKSYRAGYLPAERREIERELFTGKLTGVVATTALELGVDVGDLDATVLTGYPGTIASTWQQAGRSGRREGRSLSFLVGLDNPLDQYVLAHPDFLFGHGFEHALVNTHNPYILHAQLLCAAWELALSQADTAYFGETMGQEITALVDEGRLRARKGRYYLAPSLAYPAGGVNIRAASGEHFALVDTATGALLETLEMSHALLQAHPGAIYLHQGETYLVSQFNLKSRVIQAAPAEVNYYTQVKDMTDIRILHMQDEKAWGGARIYLGEVEVTTEVVSFRKKAQLTEEILGEEPLDLPAQRFRTVALWFDMPDGIEASINREGLDWPGTLHAAEHAEIGLLPLFAMCDRNDIGGISTPLHPDTGRAQIFIYDAYPGGVGIAEKGFDLICQLWQATLQAVTACPCQEGCPGCIQSPKCGNNNRPLDKQGAARLLQALLRG